MQQTQANTYLSVESDGLLSCVCYVPVKKSELFLAVHIEDVFLDQLYGEWAFVNLDCKVESHSVLSLIEDKLMEAANNEIQKVKIGFRAELYRNSNCATIKGQLLEILWAEIDGESVVVGEPSSKKHVVHLAELTSHMTFRSIVRRICTAIRKALFKY